MALGEPGNLLQEEVDGDLEFGGAGGMSVCGTGSGNGPEGISSLHFVPLEMHVVSARRQTDSLVVITIQLRGSRFDIRR